MALGNMGVQKWSMKGRPTTEEEFKKCFKKIVGETKDGIDIESSNPVDWGFTWKDVDDVVKRIKQEEPMSQLRKERNDLLKKTDFFHS